MKKWANVTLLGLLVLAYGGVLYKHQALLDWWHLRGYAAPPAVVQLAAGDSMTPKAQHLFYVNRPLISSGRTFTDHCPAAAEKTVVLGCYVGRDAGIYIYAVNDVRLNGVEQVTAAHEMLHAAYRRLSGSERNTVNAMLTDYYNHGLTDQRIKDTLNSYKISEPNDLVNEMHSIFGTEVAQLPAALEQYYRQYFTNRQKVTSYTASYQGEFTSRQTQVAADDAQLKTLKTQIDANEASLNSQQADLKAQRLALQGSNTATDIAAYNLKVAAYNNLLENTKAIIAQYNNLVTTRNSVAIEEQQLQQELSANPLTKQ